jgi:Ser/Thr protein kinase RdoA (MazF antagonist)
VELCPPGYILEALGTLYRAEREFLDAHPEFKDLDPPHTLRERMIDDLRTYRKLLDRIDVPPDRRAVWRLLRLARRRLRRLVDLSSALIESVPDEAVGVTICHGDSHENNYIIREELQGRKAAPGGCCMIDLESVAVGPAIEDLIVPLWGLVRYTRCRRTLLFEALGVYAGRNALTEGERRFLPAHLILPRVWHRAIIRMLRKNRSWANPKSLQRFVLGLTRRAPAERLAKAIRVPFE